MHFPKDVKEGELRRLEEMANNNCKTVSTKQLADVLGYDVKTIRRAVDAGKIPAYKLSRNLRFDPEAVRLALSNTPSKPKK